MFSFVSHEYTRLNRYCEQSPSETVLLVQSVNCNQSFSTSNLPSIYVKSRQVKSTMEIGQTGGREKQRERIQRRERSSIGGKENWRG